MGRYFTTLDAILPFNHGITKMIFKIGNICVLSCRSHLHMNSHDSKCVVFTAFAFWHRVGMLSLLTNFEHTIPVKL